MSILENVRSPEDVKGLSEEQLAVLAGELRAEILNTVAANGGHLSSNLGCVEVTLALHTVFDAPRDRIIFDVGHQSYAHKLLTGRYGRFSTLRQAGGISGFPNPEESEYDLFYEGHAGPCISEALALAVADSREGRDNYTVAVVGDGSFTNGMVYEALNNCAEAPVRLIIILNDNEMSISRNIGGLNKSLRRMRSSAGYFRFKHGLQKFLRKIPLLGKATIWLGRKFKNFVKNIVLKKNVFENLGLDYIGPVDGNDLRQTRSALAEAKRRNGCCVVHVYTRKGKGYEPAEKEPAKYHSVAPFDPAEGVVCGAEVGFSSRFGEFMCGRAREDGRICAITAAMGLGTGLDAFEKEFPERFFDVGIAEEHAVAFGAGLAAAGKLPVCAMYSTFAQRVFDQLFQEVAMANRHFVLALDRCGLVEGDGITHQGIFDYPLFSALPGAVIYSPATFAELDRCLSAALGGEGLQIVRYPKGGEAESYGWEYTESGNTAYTAGSRKCRTVIVTSGRIAQNALPCSDKNTAVVRLIKTYPPDLKELDALTASAKNVYLLEEGIREGGLAQKLEAHFAAAGKRTAVRAIEGFVKHGSLADMYGALGLLPEQIREEIKRIFG